MKLPVQSILKINRAKIIYYRLLGCSYKSIGEEFGVSYSTIDRYLKNSPATDDETKAAKDEIKKLLEDSSASSIKKNIPNKKHNDAPIKSIHSAQTNESVAEKKARVDSLLEIFDEDDI